MANKEKKLARSLVRLGKAVNHGKTAARKFGKTLIEKEIPQLLKKKKTNEEFAKNHIPFIIACRKVGVEPTPRQAGQYRRGLGRVFEVCNEQWRANSPVDRKNN